MIKKIEWIVGVLYIITGIVLATNLYDNPNFVLFCIFCVLIAFLILELRFAYGKHEEEEDLEVGIE